MTHPLMHSPGDLIVSCCDGFLRTQRDKEAYGVPIKYHQLMFVVATYENTDLYVVTSSGAGFVWSSLTKALERDRAR